MPIILFVGLFFFCLISLFLPVTKSVNKAGGKTVKTDKEVSNLGSHLKVEWS
jgi:hypothetical protein